MRVTNGMLAQTALRNIQANLARSETLQDQITSGSRIRRPSDDPIGASRALNFQDGLDQTTQYLRNIDQSSAWLNVSDSALGSATSLIQRAKELAVQGSNDTLSSQDRLAASVEIEQISQQMMNIANSKYGNRYIFSGTKSNLPAYTTATSAGFQGNSNSIEQEISPNVTVGINVDGAGIRGTLTQLDSRLDTILTARSQVGAKTNRLEYAQGRLQEIQVNLTSLLSQVKDVDMAEAITNFSVQDTVYKASLSAAAKAIQPSLLDYLQ